MKPFSITCTTCNATLTVRNEAAIGNIVSCPRCKSMVLVQPPADWKGPLGLADTMSESFEVPADSLVPDEGVPDEVAPDEGAPDEGAQAKSTPAELAPESLAARAAPLHDPLDSGWAETMPEMPLNPEVLQAESPRSQSTTARWKDVGTDDSAGDERSEPSGQGPLLPTDNWTTPATQWLSQWLLVGVAGFAGILLAVAVVAFMAYQSRRTPAGAGGELAAADPSAEAGDTPAVDPDNAATDADSTSQQPQKPQPGQPTVRPADRAPADPTLPGEVPGESTLPPTLPPANVPPANVPPTNVPPTNVPRPTDPPATIPPATDPLPAGPEKPASPPGGAENVGPPGMTPRPAATDEDVSAEAVAGLLNRFAPLLNNAPFQAGDAEPSDDAAQATAPAVPAAPAIPAAIVRPERPAPRPIDVAARLAEPIVEIAFDDTPLDGFLKFVEQFSTVPITVDMDAMTRRKLTFQAPVRLTLGNTTLGDVLAAGLKLHGLHYVEERGQLRVVALDAERREVTYPVDDLVAGQPAGAESLLPWLQKLVAPLAWQPAGGVGTMQLRGDTLVVQTTPDVHFELLLFLDKLRVARKLPPRSDYDPALFQLPTRWEQASVKLNEPFLLNFTQPTPLPRILERMASNTGTRILVDWQALGEDGWSPDASLRYATDNRPLRVALHGLLRPMDLTFRAINADTLEVTTRAALEQRPELEMYPVEDLLSDDAGGVKLLDRIREALGPDAFLPQGLGDLQFDPASRCLLARLSQPRQLELFELLAQWRAEG